MAPNFIIRIFDKLFGEPCQRMEYGGKCLTVPQDSNQLMLYECEKTLSDSQCWTWNVKNVAWQKTLNFLGDGWWFFLLFIFINNNKIFKQNMNVRFWLRGRTTKSK